MAPSPGAPISPSIGVKVFAGAGQAWPGVARGAPRCRRYERGAPCRHPVGSGRVGSGKATAHHRDGKKQKARLHCHFRDVFGARRGAVHVFRLRSGFIPYLPPFQGALIFFLCGLCTYIAHINVRCGFVTNFGLQYDNSPFAGCNKECNRASFPQKFHSFAAGLQAHAVGPRRQSSRTNK